MNIQTKRALFVQNVLNEYSDEAQTPVTEPSWDDIDDDRRQIIINLMENLHDNNFNVTASDLHQNWVNAHSSIGWAYGDVYDSVAKTHPDITTYDNLDPLEAKKFDIFILAAKLAYEIYGE